MSIISDFLHVEGAGAQPREGEHQDITDGEHLRRGLDGLGEYDSGTEVPLIKGILRAEETWVWNPVCREGRLGWGPA